MMGRYYRFICLAAILCCILLNSASAQYQGYIYAEIVLKNKDTYTGPIKWSGGQRQWNDVLTAVKSSTRDILQYLDKSQLKKLSNEDDPDKIDWQFMNLWRDKLPKRKKEALCRFGDIDFIHVTGSNKAQLYLKNGYKLRVEPHKDDEKQLGGNIVVYVNGDSKTLKWGEISRINFRPTPENLGQPLWKPLYGTINTSNGPLTGFVQWNTYKYLAAHQLTGQASDGNTVKYAFAYIAAIEKQGDKALIKLRTGKDILLGSASDVSPDNRGIVVMHPIYGRVLVTWKAFRSFTPEEPPATGFAYTDYASHGRIYASVLTTEGKVYEGTCTFDLDEEWDIEMLEGNKDGLFYQIPFYNISKITPYKRHYSQVALKDKRTLLLGWDNDVCDKNWGVMIWLPNKEHQYIPWNKISEISFR